MRLHSNSGCPLPTTLAAVADGSLPTKEREVVTAHIADCERCLGELAAIVRLGREPGLPLPASLRARVTHPPRRAWQTAAAVAATLVLSVGGWWLISRDGEFPQPAPLANDVVRSPAGGSDLPIVSRPPSNGRLAGDAVSFSWQPVASALTYRLRVMRDDGQLVWEGETSATTVRVDGTSLPRALPLYVVVTAVLPDGRTARAPAVPFSVQE